jgi:hypothetical protein
MPNSGSPSSKPSTPAPPAQKPVHVNAFGVEFDVKDKSSADGEGLSKGARAAIKLGIVGFALAIVVWWQFFRNPIDDPDIATNPQVREVIQSEQKKDTAKLMQLAASSDTLVARRAVTSLSNLGHMEGLTGPLADSRADVRAAAISGMAARPSPANLPTLTATMRKDPSPDVRIAAMRGVSNSNDFSSFDSLVEMLSDQDKYVRTCAIRAIEDKLSLRFRDYDPQSPSPAAINRIKQTIPKYRDLFETYQQHKSKAGG